jgi:hypothetical protein
MEGQKILEVIVAFFIFEPNNRYLFLKLDKTFDCWCPVESVEKFDE